MIDFVSVRATLRPMNFESKKATEADIATIRAIAQVAFPDTYKSILTPDQIDYMMEMMYSEANLRTQFSGGHVFFIAYSNGVPCGYVSVERQGEKLFHLQKIYVLPKYQGTGAGGFLFSKAVDYIKSGQPQKCVMELNVNRHNKALGFYEHKGMKKVREGDFDIGNGYFMNDYIMAIEI